MIKHTSEYKKCGRCGKRKKISLFNPRGDKNPGVRSMCKKCVYEANTENYKKRTELHEVGAGVVRIERKTCSSCGEEKDSSMFYVHIGSNDGFRSHCKECTRARHIKQTYGLERHEYENILKGQNGFCAMCGENEARCVDHNHKTGMVRGLLCNKCNIIVGFYETTPDILSLVETYLGAYKEKS